MLKGASLCLFHEIMAYFRKEINRILTWCNRRCVCLIVLPSPIASRFHLYFSAAIRAGMAEKARLLTGDTPTGKLHLGHWVGSVENRLAMQDQYECYFLIANKHAFTTRADRPEEIRQSVLDIATDWLAVGIDPNKSAMFVQSEVPAIDELTFFFAMLIPFNVVMKNPTIKDELRDKGWEIIIRLDFRCMLWGRRRIFWRFGRRWCR